MNTRIWLRAVDDNTINMVLCFINIIIILFIYFFDQGLSW